MIRLDKWRSFGEKNADNGDDSGDVVGDILVGDCSSG